MATLDQSDIDGVPVLRIAGALTVGEAERLSPLLCAAVAAARPGAVVDLSGVEVVATPGLTMLLGAQRAANDAGGVMVLTGLRGVVADVIHRCRLDVVLTIAGTVEAAVKAVKGGR